MLRKTIFIIAMCLVGLSVWSMGVGNKVRVGVFQGNGGAQTCIWETIASIQLDPDMTVRTITTGDIANGVLSDLDAIIIPGGEGATQYMNLGEENMERIRNFIRSGKGAVGISLQTHQDMLVCTSMVERQLISSMITVDMVYQPSPLPLKVENCSQNLLIETVHTSCITKVRSL